LYLQTVVPFGAGNGRATAVEEKPKLFHMLNRNSECQREKENNHMF